MSIDIYSSNVGNVIDNNDNNSCIASNIIRTESARYYEEVSGFIAFPRNDSISTYADKKKYAAVIMIHEWWGQNDDIKSKTKELAKQGYIVLAVDLYNGEVTTDADRARKLSAAVRNNPKAAIENLKSAVCYLNSLNNVDGSKIASLGWSFGGGQSLQLALNSQEHPLSATGIYYGSLITDKEVLCKIQWPVLGIFGDKDRLISIQMVNQFKTALDANGIINEIYIYNGVGHAFANPSGRNYAPKETADSWQKTLAFLKKYSQ